MTRVSCRPYWIDNGRFSPKPFSSVIIPEWIKGHPKVPDTLNGYEDFTVCDVICVWKFIKDHKAAPTEVLDF